MRIQRASCVLLLLLVSLAFVSCESPPPPRGAAPKPRSVSPPVLVAPAVFHTNKLAEMDAAVAQAMEDGRLPGGVLWLEHRGVVHRKAYGRRAVLPAPEPMSEDTVFDAASLTKVMATTPAVVLLAERGKLQIDAAVTNYVPEFTGEGRERVTVRHLLTHTSGLRSGLSLTGGWTGQSKAIELAAAEKLRQPPGLEFLYSDINFILLGEIVQRVSGQRLEQFVAREIYGPLRMTDTGYQPAPDRISRIAPTENHKTEGLLRGRVHDPTARRMGGIAGHAGVFTTAGDLARYARMMLNGGELDGARVFKPETVRWMTSVQTPTNVAARRGIGWDIDSPYSTPRGRHFPLGSYGHTGWTGTSIWIDPASRTFLIFLSNRNHPDEGASVVELRARLATLAAEAITDFNFIHVPEALPPRGVTPEKPLAQAVVLNGIDSLERQNYAPLKGLRVGLITNHTGTDRRRNPTIDLLKAAPGVRLTALFSPEHGIRGAVDEKVADSVDERTGLPVYSLYGERRTPAAAQLAGLDALVFDIQDIGCRFYTYVATMGNCLEAAAGARLKFFVLDRVNPINGAAIEGPVHAGKPSFTAFHEVPLRHGMTVGELARMFNVERGWGADLTVIRLDGWQRDFWFDQTAQPWTHPSPNMRTLNAATLYPGVGLLETAVSVGRGTDTPFEIVGAPYVNDGKLAEEMNRANLAGVRFIPVRFQPTASVFKGQMCEGVSIVLTDRQRLAAVEVGVALALAFQRLYPGQFALDKVNTLLQHRPTLDAIKAGKSLAEIRRLWLADLDKFKQRREGFLLYP